jgi:hypothetical protein
MVVGMDIKPNVDSRADRWCPVCTCTMEYTEVTYD